MEFQNMIERAMEIRGLYENKEKQLFGSSWTNEEIALGLVGDVGDLAKLIIAKNGKRQAEDVDEKLAHELADCLWSVIVLAEKQTISLEAAFMEAMDELETYLSKP
jgi:NTP pyrophosphatase (non-canonical NTP hydrolase)